jgi:hypothetical protein
MNFNDQILYAVLEDIKKSLQFTMKLSDLLMSESESVKRDELLSLALRAHEFNQKALEHFCPPGGI